MANRTQDVARVLATPGPYTSLHVLSAVDGDVGAGDEGGLL